MESRTHRGRNPWLPSIDEMKEETEWAELICMGFTHCASANSFVSVKINFSFGCRVMKYCYPYWLNTVWGAAITKTSFLNGWIMQLDTHQGTGSWGKGFVGGINSWWCGLCWKDPVEYVELPARCNEGMLDLASWREIMVAPCVRRELTLLTQSLPSLGSQL